MTKLKTFPEFINEAQSNDSTINLIVDTSASIPSNKLEDALAELPFGNFSKIKMIACGNEVENVRSLTMSTSAAPSNNAGVLNFVKDCMSGVHGSGGSSLQPAIDYIIKNKLEKNKTFIISDFMTPNFSAGGASGAKLDITKIII